MAKTWITDRWVKSAYACLPDGNTIRIEPTSEERRHIKRLPEHFRTEKYGIGKRWLLQWRENGRIRSRSFDNRHDAEAEAAAIEDAIRTSRYASPTLTRQPYGKLAKTWLASKQDIKQSTLRRYSNEMRSYVLPRWGNTPIDEISRPAIQAWIADLAAGTHPYEGRGEGKPLAPRTISHVAKKTFAGALRYATQEGWLPVNPATRTTIPKPAYVETLPVLSYAEVEAVAAHAAAISGHRRDHTLIHLLASSGIRIGEALALQCGDIDLQKRRLHVRRTWTVDIDGGAITGSPKTGKPRTTLLPGFLAPAIAELMANQPATAWLFRADNDNAINSKNWAHRVWRPALRAAGIDKSRGITIHKLRHTAASHAIAAGADIKVLQLMLGHANASETLDIYGHWLPDRLDEISAKIDEHRQAGEPRPG
ncbi:site-specific integrase [Leucobacter sp. OH1287]|uniref:tyrosine-type recombinase/integrase n=1 Tax=Leucobacter sp. OH1287 TaxID=2491049 RepID=UPI000F5D5A7C|nr:site-specific integrase [Leucobacter sp. OH1287]RRD61663.1 site-specific integrase [Leucobacter sp. OH1287]